jgi:hypothetical protein
MSLKSFFLAIGFIRCRIDNVKDVIHGSTGDKVMNVIGVEMCICLPLGAGISEGKFYLIYLDL